MQILTCSTCKESKPETEFYVRRASKTGRNNQCASCRAKYRETHRNEINAKRLADPEKNRADVKRWREERHRRDHEGESLKEWTNYIGWQFNILPEDYWAMFEVQDGKCGICKKESVGRKLAIDHDHRCCPGKRSCGKCIRGLLCGSCNPKLGFYENFETEVETWRDGRYVKSVVI